MKAKRKARVSRQPIWTEVWGMQGQTCGRWVCGSCLYLFLLIPAVDRAPGTARQQVEGYIILSGAADSEPFLRSLFFSTLGKELFWAHFHLPHHICPIFFFSPHHLKYKHPPWFSMTSFSGISVLSPLAISSQPWLPVICWALSCIQSLLHFQLCRCFL